MKNENTKKNNKGFSLVELIVVIAIMAVLMVVLAPAMLRYVEKSRVQKDDTAVHEVQRAVELALSEESVADKVNGGEEIDVTMNGGNGSISAGNPAAPTELLQEVGKTVTSTDVKLSSKTYKGKTYTIKIVSKGTSSGSDGFTVTGSWN